MKGSEIRQILADNIKKFRKLHNLSQADLAFDAGISIPFLSDIERANKWPYPETLAKIASVFDIEIYELFLLNNTTVDNSKKIYNKKIFDELITAQNLATKEILEKYFSN